MLRFMVLVASRASFSAAKMLAKLPTKGEKMRIQAGARGEDSPTSDVRITKKKMTMTKDP